MKRTINKLVKLSGLACLMAACSFSLSAQTLQLQYLFGDGPGTTTTNSPASAIYPVSLKMVSSSLAAVDLHGAAGSGVQGQGTSLNLSTNPIAGNANGAWAYVSNSPALASLGIVSNFTATIWFKMPTLFTNIANAGPRLFVLAPPGATDVAAATTLGLAFGSRSAATQSANPADCLDAYVSSTLITPPVYYNFPTNVWIFCALSYDSVSGNAYVYYGTEASPAKLLAVKTVGVGTNFNFSAGASLSIGNKLNNGRSFTGLIDDFRFYTGTATPAFIESIRESSTPVAVTSLAPDGTVLMSGTNTLSFNVGSANGINPANIKVAVNGFDVSSSLQFSGNATNQTVTYNNLPVNPLFALSATPNLDGVSVGISVTDNSGITTTNFYVYDAFSSTNYAWEAEDYDYNGGSFTDDPTFAFDSTDPYYQTSGSGGIDYVGYGKGGGVSYGQVYRSPADVSCTQYSVGAGNNSGNSLGELMRQKVLDALALNPAIRDVNIGYFQGPTAANNPGEPNWYNYTHNYPAGSYYVYMRAACGISGPYVMTLAEVTSGQGSPSQTTTNLGSFNYSQTGGWESYAWCPLLDTNGNIVSVTLPGGPATFQLSVSSTAGGGNVNFLMLVPAGVSPPPVVSNYYPNGTNMFQPASALTFTVSSPGGADINAPSISVQLTTTTLLGQTTVTNFTTANGMTLTGAASSYNASVPLLANRRYTAVISAYDANGSPVSKSITFDTMSPLYTFDASDYDYNGGSYLPNPISVDGYQGLSGLSGTDYYYANASNPTNGYRDSVKVGVEIDTDTPKRLQYLTNSPVPQAYDLGYYNSGNWVNYTRNWPAGQYNLYVRAADGSTSVTGKINLTAVSAQATNALGSFTIPMSGGWQTFTWAPLLNTNGNLANFTGGSVQTLRATAAASGQNVFFYALFPAAIPTLYANASGNMVTLSYQSDRSHQYQLLYKNNLTDSTWTPLGSPMAGNNSIESMTDTMSNSNRFYRVQIQ